MCRDYCASYVVCGGCCGSGLKAGFKNSEINRVLSTYFKLLFFCSYCVIQLDEQ